MNFKIDVLLNFDGDADELEELVADIGEVIVRRGYGNELNEGLKSVMIVNDFVLDEESEYEDWLQEQIDNGAFAALPVAEMEEDV